jgi:hypothetical protein
MRRLLTLFAALFFLIPKASRAQIVSVYVTYAPVYASNVYNGYNGPAYTSFWASGVGGGATIKFLPLPVVSLSLDLRGSTKPGTTGVDTALAGIKLGIHPPGLRVKAYVEGAAGYLATRTYTGVTSGSVEDKNLAFEILGGIDYPLVHFIDLRIIEVGGGTGFYGFDNNVNPNLFTINTGLVLHF